MGFFLKQTMHLGVPPFSETSAGYSHSITNYQPTITEKNHILIIINKGVSYVMGVPPARWMVYFMENPDLNWMMTGGTPMTKRKPPYIGLV